MKYLLIGFVLLLTACNDEKYEVWEKEKVECFLIDEGEIIKSRVWNFEREERHWGSSVRDNDIVIRDSKGEVVVELDLSWSCVIDIEYYKKYKE